MSNLEKTLRLKREKLYQDFDNISELRDFYDLQEKLADEIIESEKKITNNISKAAWQIHLDRIYSIGDAIAWSVLSKFVIRQLGKHESIKTSITGQGESFKKLLEDFKERSNKKLYIFSDLTRCIRIGDVILVNSPEDINIIEAKSSISEPLTAKRLLSGRSGRQFSKIFWLSHFLANEYGQLYKEEKPTKTIEVQTEVRTHFNLIPELLDNCLSNKTSLIQAEEGLVYLAQKTDENSDESVYKSAPRMRSAVYAGTARLIEEKTSTAYHLPILNFPIDLKYRILLNEVDIIIVGFLDLEYVKSQAMQFNYKFSYSKKYDMPVIEKGKNAFGFNIRFVNDILINFISVESTLRNFIELFEHAEKIGSKLTKKEENYIKNRPKNLDDFIEFSEKNYVTAMLDKDGNILEVIRLDGTKIQ